MSSCIQILDPADRPNVDWESIERSYEVLDSGQKVSVEGVYYVEEGKNLFGDSIVLRWAGRRLCLYSRVDVIFGELAGGVGNSSLHFEGYYTNVRSASSTNMSFSGDTLLKEAIVFNGSVINGGSVRFRRARTLKKSSSHFYIIAHRGGGRNSDRLLRSENSIEMMMFASTLGANAVEIDIRLTKDRQLIVFHDETFSPRTVRGSYLLGDVRKFSLHDIKRYGRLVYGESIPTLKEMLHAAIDSTELDLVWLDVKPSDAVTEIIEAQREALEYAKDKGKNIQIVFGIPTNEILSAYKNSSLANTTPVLCELGADVARSLPTCTIWAPRWTNGTQQAEVQAMHANNIRVVTWTVDVKDYILQFLRESTMDGILSNYPSLVCAMYH